VGVPIEQELLLDVGREVGEDGPIIERQLLHHRLDRKGGREGEREKIEGGEFWGCIYIILFLFPR